MSKRYVLHEGRSGKFNRWSVFDNVERRDIRGMMGKAEALRTLARLKNPRRDFVQAVPVARPRQNWAAQLWGRIRKFFSRKEA